MKALTIGQYEMDLSAIDLTIFFAATFLAAIVAGVAGFAFGLIAAAARLHVLTPLQTATLIVAFGLIVQGIAVWKLRASLEWRRLWPFLAGAVIGVPAGVMILGRADPGLMRQAVGILLIVYSIYGLIRPSVKPIRVGGQAVDAGIGVLNGILGGASGLAGILVTIWCGFRGWPKSDQRAVFQPVSVAVFALSAIWLGAGGAIDRTTIWLSVLGLPVLLAGTWLGLQLYGRLDEAEFRKLVLVLLMASGVALAFARS
jgi:uncharacterized membrane protein YfcA